MKKPTWISEREAADMIGYKPETFRKKVKAAILDIAYFTINGRKYKYCKEDIERVMLEHSTFIDRTKKPR